MSITFGTSRLHDGDDGAVVNVTDWRTARPYRDHFSYSVAKGGLDSFTLAAAEALAPRIRVNAVAPSQLIPGIRPPPPNRRYRGMRSGPAGNNHCG